MDTSPVDLAVKAALSEDLCADFSESLNDLLTGKRTDLIDVTSDAVFSDDKNEAVVISKSEGVLSGSAVFQKVFQLIDPSLSVIFFKKEGDPFHISEKIVSVKGRVKSILMGERTALNFLGHLSGIATEVSRLVRILEGTRIKILDTRKTLPGLRELEKRAVVHGGGKNHRMGLYDMVLIKDNHIDAAGSITGAVQKVRSIHADRFKIEIECRSMGEVEEALSLGVDRIMLDNMPGKMVKRAVKLIGGKTEVEVSGSMNRKRIKKLRGIPVDYISAGYITNSTAQSDFSMKILG
ncbi:MAG: carboxylating nicotinate-nucleotide diphosphorylase [Spirochaetes bacterium]|nr:carboxylating nicotinate-nucleotide diphosphorylase [Spirochaetota bacterium]